ncbi:MAG: hypothetical protein QXU32_02750 [Nitrososphaerales archaeon]
MAWKILESHVCAKCELVDFLDSGLTGCYSLHNKRCYDLEWVV